MSKAIEWLKGKKTYFVLAAAAVVYVLAAVNVLSPDAAASAYGVLSMLGGATVAAKINRLSS